MAITRYAGDRFVIGSSPDVEPTGVLDGAFLINTGNLSQKVLRNGTWTTLAGGGGGGGGTPSDPDTSVQFNNGGSFGGNTNLTFTDSNRLNVNKLGISGNVYDSNNWIGEGGMILANEGATGVNWKNIESVLSGVGGSGVANYVARWSDEDTLTTGTLYDDGTKVGIGITAPVAKLHIDDSAIGDNKALYIQNTNNTNDDSANIRFGFAGTDNANKGGIFFKRTASYGRGSLIFATENTATDDNVDNSDAKLTILADGKVGIGTDAPFSILHTNDSSGAIYHLTRTSGNTSGTLGVIRFGNTNIDSNLAGINAIQDGATDNAKITFTTQPAGGATTEQMVIKSDGKVGIGTTDPGEMLQVGDGTVNGTSVKVSSASWAQLKLISPNTNGAYIMFGDPEDEDIGNIFYYHGSNANYMSFTTNASEQMRIDKNGNVGIGAVSPSVGLQVGNSVLNETKLVVFNSEGGVSAGLTVKSRTNRAKLLVQDNDSSAYVIAEGGKSSFGRSDSLSANNITVQTDGNVGIGQVNPGADLVVQDGQIWAGVGATKGYDFHDLGTGWGYKGMSGPSRLGIFTDANERITILTDGNVGIGTTNPGGRLETYVTAGGQFGLRLNSNFGGGNAVDFNPYISSVSNAGFSIDLAASTKLVIKSDGKVGIGTASPNNLLTASASHTSYAVAGGGAFIEVARTSGADAGFLINKDTGQWAIGIDNSDGANPPLKFEYDSGGSAHAGFTSGAQMALTYDGKVGIGTAAPSAALDVVTSSTVWAAEINQTNTSNGDGLYVNTGSTASADYVASFRANNVNVLAVKANGKVGIGTATPSSLLELYSSAPELTIKDGGTWGTNATAYINLKDSSSSMAYIGVTETGGDLDIKQIKAGAVRIFTNNTEKVRVLSDGKVGIGTSAPTFLSGGGLHISNATAARLHLTDSDAGEGAGDGGYVAQIGTELYLWNFENGAVSFGTSAGEKMRIDSAGKVGIGTDGSGGKLQIVQGGAGRKSTFSTSLGLTIQANDNSVPAALNLVNTYAGANYGTTLGYQLGYSGSSSAAGELVDAGKITVAATQTWTDVPNTQDSYMTFQTAKNGSLSEHVRINQDGEVGIGTDDPIAQLHISGADISDQVLIQNSSASSTSAPDLVLDRPSTTPAAGDNIGLLQFRGRNSAGESINYASLLTNIVDKTDGDEDGKLSFYTYNGGTETESMVIKSNYVGIGVALPEHKLHVAGDAIISGYLYDSTNSTGTDGYVFTTKENGPRWEAIEDVLSGVGGNGTAEYIPRWTDSDTIGDSVIAQSGSAIGIGTAAPESLLHLAGADPVLTIRDTEANVANASAILRLAESTASDTLNNHWDIEFEGSAAGGDLVFERRGGAGATTTEAMRLTPNGKVGIGTNAPDTLLHVYDASATPVVRIQGNTGGSSEAQLHLEGYKAAATAGAVGSIIFENHNANEKLGKISVIKNSTSVHDVGDMAFYTHATGGTGDPVERMRILHDGNVGIGITNPGALLNVAGTVSVAGGTNWAGSDNQTAAIYLSNNNYGLYGNFAGYARNLIKVNSRIIEIGQNSTLPLGMKFILGTASSIGYEFRTQGTNVALKIHGTTGNVGIGATSPGAKLHVVEGNGLIESAAARKLTLAADDSGNYIHVGSSTNHDFQLVRNNVVGFSLGSTYTSVNDQTGVGVVYVKGSKVGIGINDPDEKLHIVTNENSFGGMIIDNSNTGTGSIAGIELRNNLDDRFYMLNHGSARTVTRYGITVASWSEFLAQDAPNGFLIGTGTSSTPIVFGTNSNERVRILGDGKVGIGTTAPGEKLEVVNGAVKITNTAAAQLILRGDSGNSGDTGVVDGIIDFLHDDETFGYRLNTENHAGKSAFHIQEWRSSAYQSRLYIDEDGNVGIGTTNPAQTLDVRGSIYISSGNRITWANGDAEIIEGAHSNYSLTFNTYDGVSAMTTNLFLKSGGNVGIGTTAPGFALDIRKPTNNNDDTIVNIQSSWANTTANKKIGSVQFSASDAQVNSGNDYVTARIRAEATNEWTSAANVNSHILFQTISAASLDERMRITHDGNVGIGDNLIAPEHRLHVSGDAIISGVLYDSINSSGVAGHVFTSEVGGPQWKMIEDVLSGVGGDGTAEYIPRWIDSDTIGDSVIAQSGSAIGIGTAAPDKSLTIQQSSDNDGIKIWGFDDKSHEYAEMYVTSAGNCYLDTSERFYFNLLNAGGIGIFRYVGNEVAQWNNLGFKMADNKQVSFGGGVDFYIKHDNTNDILKIYDAGAADGIVIDNAGKVGIGTTNPSQLLCVDGTIAARNSSSIQTVLIGTTSSHGHIIINNSGGVTKARMDSSGVSYFNGGNVGIGTAAPSRKFTVEGGSGDNLPVRIIGGASTTKSSLEFKDPTTTGFYKVTLGSVGDNMFLQAGGGERVRIKSDGNVGIGTNAPGSLLTVYENDSAEGNTELHVHNDKADDAAVLILEGKRASYNDTGQVLFRNNGTSVALIKGYSAATDGALGFFTKTTAGSLDEKLTISDVGAATFTGDVKAAQFYTGYDWTTRSGGINIGNQGLTTGAVSFFDDVLASSASIYRDGESVFFVGARGGVNTAGIAIATDGKVGIGITNPGNKLQVNGSVSITEYLKHDGDADTYLRFETNKSTLYGGGLGLVVASGKVGIGTATSTYNLKVQGTSKITGTLSVGGVFTTDGNTTLGTIASNSHTINGTLDLDDSKLTLGGSGGTAGYHLQTDGSGNVSWAAGTAGFVDGSGTANYIPRWTDSDTIGDSIITVPSNNRVQVNGSHTSPFEAIGQSAAGISYSQFVNSSTSAVGNGVGLELRALTSTQERQLSFITSRWLDNTDASRKSRLIITTQDGGAGYNTYQAFGKDPILAADAGNVGIGITNPSSKLHVNGTATTNSGGGNATLGSHLDLGDNQRARFGAGDDLQIYHDGSNSYMSDQGTGALLLTASTFKVMNAAGNENMIYGVQDGEVKLYHNNLTKLATTSTGVDITGNVNFNTSADITFGDNLGAALEFKQGSDLYMRFNTTNGSEIIEINKGATIAGAVTANDGINLPDNRKALFGTGNDLEIYHDGSNSYIDEVGTGDLIIKGGNDIIFKDAVGNLLANMNQSNSVELYFGGSKKFETTSTGVIITGQLSATTKSFLIDHPDPEKKKKGIKLQHGSLEGPEHSVFVRGKSSSSIIPLPDYWRHLIDEDSITVQLTPIGQHQKLYVQKVTHDSVMVGSEGNSLNYFYTVFAERIDTGKLEVEI